jgi:hypothetical protein
VLKALTLPDIIEYLKQKRRSLPTAAYRFVGGFRSCASCPLRTFGNDTAHVAFGEPHLRSNNLASRDQGAYKKRLRVPGAHSLVLQ